MKVIQDQGPAPITSGNMETVDIGISDNHEDQLMILNVLSDTLYTDKISAVLREYGCNGVDATIEAGVNRPISVRLPNRLEASVAIRDYGFGMTEQEILNTFCKLGRSTKRNSNAYTGMLGIGSKAGFAYGNSFAVTSISNGVKTIYDCYRHQGVPKMAKMHSEPTTEPNGVEIKVPVRQQDVAEFAVRAERVFRYFRVRPEISGAPVHFTRPKPEFSGKDWRFTGDGHSFAIMGNVGYDLTESAMGTLEPGCAALLKSGIELDFNIGELEIAANREGLQYRDHTKKQISDKLKQVVKEIAVMFSGKLTGAKSEWEAKCLYHDILENIRGTSKSYYATDGLSSVLSGNLIWKGKQLTSARVTLRPTHNYTTPAASALNGVTIVSYEKPWATNSTPRKTIDPEYVHASKFHTLCHNDLPAISPTRVRGFFQNNATATQITFFTFGSDKIRQDYWDKYLKDAPFIQQSTLPKFVPPAGTSSGSSAPSVHKNKHQCKAFILRDTGAKMYSDARSMWWDTTSVDYKDDKGVYVLLDAFYVKEPDSAAPTQWISQHPDSLLSAVKALRKAGLISAPVVHGFKRDRTAKLGSGWVPLETHIKERFEAIQKGRRQFWQEQSDFVEAKNYKWFINPTHVTKFPIGTAMHTLLAQVTKMLTPPTIELHQMLYTKSHGKWLIQPRLLKPSCSITALEATMFQRYPALTLIPRSTAAFIDDPKIDIVVEYVNLVEKDFAGRTGTTKKGKIS
jgi:hypothetical protein